MSDLHICANPTCRLPDRLFTPIKHNQRFCGAACKQAAWRISRNKSASQAQGSAYELLELPECGLSVTGAPAGRWYPAKSPSWVDAPSDDAPVLVSVRGEQLKLDFIAWHLDPGVACRELLALDLHGRIGFVAATGTVGVVATIDAAAKLTVSEGAGRSIRFVPWHPFERSFLEGD